MNTGYCLSHYLCPPGLPLLEFLDIAVARGFVGVGLTQRALEEIDPARLRTELRNRGLAISSVNSAGYFLDADPAAREQQAARNRWFVEAAAELGAAPLNVIVGGVGQGRGSLTIETARARAAQALAAFGHTAAARGVPILFEPIHPIGMWEKGCVHSLAESQIMIAGLQRATINLDFFHSWWDTDLHPFLANADSPLGLVQLCDVAPCGPDHVPRRVPLGEGMLDLPGLIRACRARAHRPLLELELFAFQMPDRPFIPVLDACVDYLKRLDEKLAASGA